MSVARIGVELEGAWDLRPRGFTHDGSVSVSGRHVGELPSPPMRPADAPAWMREHYPVGVNRSCGMHVHMSFTQPVEYSTLMTHADKVEARILEVFQAWGERKNVKSGHALWDRLSGSNHYCERGTANVDAQAEARNKGGDRYRILNFCYSLHGTLECRLLPMFAMVEMSVSAVETLVETVNALLTELPRPKKLKVETNLGPVTSRVWQKGYRVTLQAAPAVRAAARQKLFARGPSPYATRAEKIADRLLQMDYVCEGPMSEAGMKRALDRVRSVYSRLKIAVTEDTSTEVIRAQRREQESRDEAVDWTCAACGYQNGYAGRCGGYSPNRGYCGLTYSDPRTWESAPVVPPAAPVVPPAAPVVPPAAPAPRATRPAIDAELMAHAVALHARGEYDARARPTANCGCYTCLARAHYHDIADSGCYDMAEIAITYAAPVPTGAR